EAVNKLKEDLAYRTPKGYPLKHIVLRRCAPGHHPAPDFAATHQARSLLDMILAQRHPLPRLQHVELTRELFQIDVGLDHGLLLGVDDDVADVGGAPIDAQPLVLFAQRPLDATDQRSLRDFDSGGLLRHAGGLCTSSCRRAIGLTAMCVWGKTIAARRSLLALAKQAKDKIILSLTVRHRRQAPMTMMTTTEQEHE